MVKMLALATFRRSDNRQIVHAGQQIDVSEPYGRQLEKLGHASQTIGGAMRAPRRAAGGGKTDPTVSRPTGGPTGAKKSSASSSPAARAPAKRTSKPPVADPDSSRSTTLGSSPRGQTSSTPATGDGGKRTRAKRGSRASRSPKT